MMWYRILFLDATKTKQILTLKLAFSILLEMERIIFQFARMLKYVLRIIFQFARMLKYVLRIIFQFARMLKYVFFILDR
jgi:hypothetical protein